MQSQQQQLLLFFVCLFISYNQHQRNRCLVDALVTVPENPARPPPSDSDGSLIRKLQQRKAEQELFHQHPELDEQNFVTQFEGLFSTSMLKDHWGRKPLLIRGAFVCDHPTLEEVLPSNNAESTSCKTPWPSWEAIMELACEEEGTRLIRNVPGDLASYTMDVGPLNLVDLLDESLADDSNLAWTVLVNDVDRCHPDLSDWMDRTFAFLPRWRRDDAQISLANTLGGIGPHVDNYDVFLLQTSGIREWQVGVDKVSAQEELDNSIPGIPLRILHDWDDRPKESYTLRPGDVLYIPPRIPHCGTAQSNKCMTVSVGCRAPSAYELVSKLAEEVTSSVAPHAMDRYQDWNLVSQSLAPSMVTNSVHELTMDVKQQMKALVIHAMQEILDNDDQWDSLVGRLVTEPKRPREDYPMALADMEWREELGLWGIPGKAVEAARNGDGVLYRAEGVAATFSRVHDSLYRLFMNGSAFDVPVMQEEKEATRSLLTAIVGEPAITSETISPLSHQPVVLELLETLVDQGLLYGTTDDE